MRGGMSSRCCCLWLHDGPCPSQSIIDESARSEVGIERSALHPCAAMACDRQIPIRFAFCGKHWNMLPRGTMSGIGALDGKAGYVLAVHDAVWWLAVQEGLHGFNVPSVGSVEWLRGPG